MRHNVCETFEVKKKPLPDLPKEAIEVLIAFLLPAFSVEAKRE